MTAHHIKGHRPERFHPTRSRGPAEQRGRWTAKEATSMSDGTTSQDHGAGRCEIRVSGHLASRWGAWFDGMTLTRHDDGTTAISGTVTDQAALHGLLRRLNDMGVPLVSVTLTAPGRRGPTPPPVRADRPNPAPRQGGTP
jgi:hypothetical protein